MILKRISSIQTKFITLSVVILSSFWILSCESGNNVNVKFENGISDPIREMLGDELLEVLENELGLPIHRGKNPPNVEARLLASSMSVGEATIIMRPNILEATNVPGDGIQPGGRFRDTLFRFSNQDNKNLTVDFDRIVLGSRPFIGDNSHIIGEGNNFTVFGTQLDIVEQDTVVSVNFLSGSIEDDGIHDTFGGIIVVEDRDISIFIPSGTGRVFKDGDGISRIEKWPSVGEMNIWDNHDLINVSGDPNELMMNQNE